MKEYILPQEVVDVLSKPLGVDETVSKRANNGVTMFLQTLNQTEQIVFLRQYIKELEETKSEIHKMILHAYSSMV